VSDTATAPAIFEKPADGYYHVCPLGTFSHPDGVDQVLDNKACESMVKTFNKEKEAAGANFPGLLADFDHFSHDDAHPSEAAGWIEDLQNRADGLYAKIKFSDVGDAAVTGGRYRLVSPVWKHRDCEDLGNDKVRPLRLDGIGLTNSPNIRGMRPLSNREKEALLNRRKEREAKTAPPASHFNVSRAASRNVVLEVLKNAGNSAGAHKGWETRHGQLAEHHSNLADQHEASAKQYEQEAATTKDKFSKGNAERLAASYKESAAGHRNLAGMHAAAAADAAAKADSAGSQDAQRKAGNEAHHPVARELMAAGIAHPVGIPGLPKGVQAYGFNRSRRNRSVQAEIKLLLNR
jgi:phage I-like protein